MSYVSAFIVFASILIVATVAAGFFRVEIDPVALRAPRRVVNELFGVGLVVAIVAAVALFNRSFPGGRPVAKGPSTILGGVIFLLLGVLLVCSYFVPRHNATFGLLSSLWANSPGAGGGPSRPGLLILGFSFSLMGLCILVIGSGFLG